MIKLSLCLGLGLLLCCNASDLSGRIIDGRSSQPEDAVAVTIYSLINEDDPDAYLTTGVAISPRLVLGTGQACYTFINNNVVTFERHKIGFNYITLADQEVADVAYVVIHPNYDIETLQFNIAAFHFDSDLITTFVLPERVGIEPIPYAVKVHGYGPSNLIESYSPALLTTIGAESSDCLPVLNSLVYGPTNHCVEAAHELAQGDQGGPITNTWLVPDTMALFGLVSFWSVSNPKIIIMTNLKHPEIASFIYEQENL